jgi:hypothetical protein
VSNQQLGDGNLGAGDVASTFTTTLSIPATSNTTTALHTTQTNTTLHTAASVAHTTSLPGSSQVPFTLRQLKKKKKRKKSKIIINKIEKKINSSLKKFASFYQQSHAK